MCPLYQRGVAHASGWMFSVRSNHKSRENRLRRPRSRKAASRLQDDKVPLRPCCAGSDTPESGPIGDCKRDRYRFRVRAPPHAYGGVSVKRRAYLQKVLAFLNRYIVMYSGSPHLGVCGTIVRASSVFEGLAVARDHAAQTQPPLRDSDVNVRARE